MPSATSTTSPTNSPSGTGSGSTPPHSNNISPSSTGCTSTTLGLSPADALLRADINRRLLESGEYEKLTTHLAHLLRESGWRESTLSKCNRALRDPDAKITNYISLYNAVEREAIDSVDVNVRMEVVRRIREVLEGLVEL